MQSEDGANDDRLAPPDYLQRVIDSCQTSITSGHQAMMLAMHAVLLETGLRSVSQVSASLFAGCHNGCKQ